MPDIEKLFKEWQYWMHESVKKNISDAAHKAAIEQRNEAHKVLKKAQEES